MLYARLDHEAWVDWDSPQPDAMEHESTATEVDPDIPLLLRAVGTLRIPEVTMDQGDWLAFRPRWQDALVEDPSGIDAQLAILLAYLPSLTTLILCTMEISCKGLTLEMLHRFAGREDLSGARPYSGPSLACAFVALTTPIYILVLQLNCLQFRLCRILGLSWCT